MNNKLFHCRFNTIGNKTELDGSVDPFSVEPRAIILFTLGDSNEIEASVHFYPPLKEDHSPTPATHQMAVYMYTAFANALKGA